MLQMWAKDWFKCLITSVPIYNSVITRHYWSTMDVECPLVGLSYMCNFTGIGVSSVWSLCLNFTCLSFHWYWGVL